MTTKPASFRTGIVLFQGIDLLDVAAPFEILNWMAKPCQQIAEAVQRDIQYFPLPPVQAVLAKAERCQM